MNPNFVRAVRLLYPGVSFISDVRIDDDGTGPKLVAWNLPGTPPDDNQIAAVIASDDANTARRATFAADASRIDLLNRLRTATAAQIDTWVTGNVTTLAQARTLLATIVKAIALDARQ